MKSLTLLLDNDQIIEVRNKTTLKGLMKLAKKLPFSYVEYSEFLIHNFPDFDRKEKLLFSVEYAFYDPQFKLKDHVTIIFGVSPRGVHCDWSITKEPLDREELSQKYNTFLETRPELVEYHTNVLKKSLVVSN